jgi:hypothetical protein
MGRTLRPWQFGLDGLLATTFCIAASLAVWRQAQEQSFVRLAILAIWFSIGAYRQAADQWRAGHELPRDARGSLGLVLAGRVLVLPLLLLPVLGGAMPPGLADEPFTVVWTFGRSGRDVVEGCLLLLIAISIMGSRGSGDPTETRRLSQRGMTVLTWICVVILVVQIVACPLFDTALVHQAINGILNLLPPRPWNRKVRVSLAAGGLPCADQRVAGPPIGGR